MSGLAEILLEEHFTISGSDSQKSPLTEKLTNAGAKIFYGQRASNIEEGTDLVVYTAAIHEDNPELAAAKAAGIPTLTRAELLGQIMDNYSDSVAIAGTHGKTTTTSMVSQIFLDARMDPTISVGGILDAIGGNIRVGKSNLFVTEACEYTNSFLNFRPKYCLILNIEEDHLDFFKDINDIRHSFRLFAENTAPDGVIVLNGAIEQHEAITEGLSAKIVTYGLSADNDFYASDISYNEKIDKLNKYFDEPDEITANILIKVKGYNQTIEVTIPTTSFTIRNEESAEDLYAAIDSVVDKIERQIRKNKTKINKISKNALKKLNLMYQEEEKEEDTKIVRRKTLNTKPMSEEEAILQMEMLGHDFFIFKDSNTSNICILYKRKDNNYGVIETE